MSGGRFLVSLTEVPTSEEPEHTGEGDYVDAFVQKFELD